MIREQDVAPPARQSIADQFAASMEELAIYAENTAIYTKEKLTRFIIPVPAEANTKNALSQETYPDYFQALRESLQRIEAALTEIKARVRDAEL